jgi:hypothetical protein
VRETFDLIRLLNTVIIVIDTVRKIAESFHLFGGLFIVAVLMEKLEVVIRVFTVPLRRPTMVSFPSIPKFEI